MYKIKLFCNAGMSTSILVNRMNKAAQADGIEADIHAYSVREIDKQIQDADCILLGPQVAFIKKEVEKKCEEFNIPVSDISSYDYGFGDGEKVLKSAIKMIEEKNNA